MQKFAIDFKPVAAPKAFDIGKSGRRLAAIPAITTVINNEIRKYGSKTVARSRYLCRNNPYASAAKDTYVSALVGAGIKPSTLDETPEVKKEVQQLWFDWCAHADYDGVLDFYGLQGLAAGELFEAGEAFLVFEDRAKNVSREGVPSTQLRLLQSEMLPYWDIPQAGVVAGNYVDMGIEFDQSGNRVAYHFLKRLPMQNAGAIYDYGTERIKADQVLHLFRPVLAGQIRGIPRTLAGMVTLAMLDLYDDAELERKRVAALFAGFVTKAEGDDSTGSSDSPLGGLMEGGSNPYTRQDSFGLEPGALITLEEGEDVAFSEPADVGGSYEAFQYRNLLRAAAGFGVPYFSLTGDLKSFNYSSIRAGLVEFRRRTEAEQHSVFIYQLCRPTWNRWLDTATVYGLVPWSVSDYRDPNNRRLHRRVKWLPPKWDWVDPYKDRQAEKLAVDNGFKARSDVIEAEGYDPEEVDQRIQDDQKRAAKMGIKLGDPMKPDPAPAPGQPGKPGEPGEDDGEEPEDPAEDDEKPKPNGGNNG